MNKAEKLSDIIKQQAIDFGFLSCGISKVHRLDEQEKNLENWLKNEMHGEMSYMENHFEMRLNPKLLLEDAKSIISLSYNYYPENQQNKSAFKISKYAYGKDYHKIIKDKLYGLVKNLQEKIGDFSFRVFVDSAPILEKTWAKKSGLGWIGKNSNLITKQVGSFYFLAEIVCDLELKQDSEVKDFCGSCTKCIDACPTQAIEKPYVVNGSKCISYATIELKNEIPNYFKDKMDDWIFGCDICQDVCPWNRFSKPTLEPKFTANEKLLNYTKENWKELTEELFQEIFKQSAVKRTKYKGLTRNIKFLSN
ncbi:MAG: tRNA epoxyqueuosine(34) reductase QueG [Flavobacteriales bacterium]|nr:tRNA epoxyqueuosine(34) reductase QueG [Flavobacteriales bacterium]